MGYDLVESASSSRLGTLTFGMAVLIMSAFILKTLSFLFIPFAVALLCCYALDIPMEFLQRFRVPVALRIMLVVICGALLIYLFGRLLQANILEFQERMPEFETTFWGYAERVLASLDINRQEARQVFAAFVDNFKHADLKSLGEVARRMGGSFFSFLGNFFWVLLLIVFMLAERESMAGRLARGLGEENAAGVMETLARVNLAVRSYLGIKILLSAVTGLLVGVVLKGFGVPFAFLWAVLTFLLNFIPNIGSVVATIPPVAMAFFQSGSAISALWVASSLIAVQMVVGNFLEPRMMGKGLDLSPLVVLLSLLFWGWMWGVVGMLIAVPLTAAIKIACEQIEFTRPAAVMISGA